MAQSQDHRHMGGMSGGHEGGPGWGRGGPAPMRGPQQMRGPEGAPAPGFDPRRYNGYWVGRRWYYGEPAPPTYAAPGYRPGFTPWQRGAYLPPAYQSFEINDFDRYHLRRPPYGYHWVQVGNECLLVSLATGQIFDVVMGPY
ncbi:MAG TPA: RcnB family protein [Caulobacteraceae bacterium]